MTETIDLNGLPTLSGTVFEPRVGLWFAEVEIDSDEVPEGAAILSFFDEVEFSGTIVQARSTADEGRTMVRLEAGSGQLDEWIGARHHRDTTVGGLLDDLVSETGDAVDPDSTVLATPIRYWSRPHTIAEAYVGSIAQALNVAWRVQRSGLLWLGTEDWPDVELNYTQGPRTQGGTVILPDRAPEVYPGATFLGNKVGEVVTSWGSTSKHPLTQSIKFEDAETPGPYTVSVQHDFADWFTRTFGVQLDLSALYPCKVLSQSTDLTSVDLVPDDGRIKGSGLKGVKIRYGSPGQKHVLKGGARCHLGFDAADPRRPFAGLFDQAGISEYVIEPESGTDVTIRVTGANVSIIADRVQITADSTLFNEGGQEIACKGDLVAFASPTAAAPGVSCAPPIPGAPTLFGQIVSGRPKVKAS